MVDNVIYMPMQVYYDDDDDDDDNHSFFCKKNTQVIDDINSIQYLCMPLICK